MDNQIPLVSVVVLTFNHEKYITQALDSILMQQVNFPYEILVGDDCSTDHTQDILKHYADEYPGVFRLFLREKNLGPTKNLYDVMRHASGRYMASCEGDDFWTDPHKLQLQIDFLESHRQYVGCVHPISLVDEEGMPSDKKKLQWIRFGGKPLFTLKSFNGVIVPGHAVSMVKRNLFLEENFCGELICHASPFIADRTIALLWLEHGDFYRLDQTMASYRVSNRGSNLTSVMYSNNPNKIAEDYVYTKNLESYAQSHHLDAGFVYHKRELFVKSILLAIRNHSVREFLMAKQILKESDRPMKYIMGFLPTALSLIRRSY